MTRRRVRTVEDWRRMLFRSSSIAPRVRLGLLDMADFMNEDRVVSRPRHLIASDMGITERSVDRIISAAHEAGLLSTVRRGQKGVTAVYQGTFPTPVQRDNRCRPEISFSATESSALKVSETVALKPSSARQHVVAPIDTQVPAWDAYERLHADALAAYDPATHQTTGSDERRVRRDSLLAALSPESAGTESEGAA